MKYILIGVLRDTAMTILVVVVTIFVAATAMVPVSVAPTVGVVAMIFAVSRTIYEVVAILLIPKPAFLVEVTKEIMMNTN